MKQKENMRSGIEKGRLDEEFDKNEPAEDFSKLSKLLVPNSYNSSLKDEDSKASDTDSGLAKPPQASLEKPSDNDNDSKVAELKRSKWTVETPQPIFLSCSALSRYWRRVPSDVLESALFFFGSKRKWLFPQTKSDGVEARRQPGRYHKIDRLFLELVQRKDSRGEVCFLKRPDLHFEHDEKDPNAYFRVSEWLKQQGYPEGLQLNEEWWKKKPVQEFRYTTNSRRVISNFKTGSHSYEEVKELVYQSSGGRLKP